MGWPEYRGTVHSDQEHTVVFVEDQGPVVPPTAFRIVSLVMLALGGLFMAIVVSVAGFLFVQVVVHLIMNYEPLTPWVKAVQWLWSHGEVSVPAVTALTLMLAVPRARRKAWDIVVCGVVYIGLGIVGTIIAAVIYWLTWLVLTKPEGI